MSAAPPWRHFWLAALVVGLLLAPLLEAPGGWPLALAAGAGAIAAVTALRRRRGQVPLAVPGRAGIAGLALLAGLGVGDARLVAAEADALGPGDAGLTPGDRARVEGFVVTMPRALGPMTRFAVSTPAGRLGVAVPEPLPEIAVGTSVAAEGRLEEPEDWLAGLARRDGWALELRARVAERIPGGRGGVAGLLDRARTRAERGLTSGLDPPEAALARGFVLGQDEAIDPLVREDFRRSGLAHLLAVSGQNVMLLAILAGVLLAALGVPPRLRLVAIVLVIAAYVPIAGAGPSIQRAGVMGAAAILAGLAGRGIDRAWIVLLALAATLVLDPLASADPGWQLSFAAVLGIALWARRLARLLEGRLGGRSRRPLLRRVARPLAEGAALTLAATIATAPLIAHHFGTLSFASLPANLVVLPAVAPVMWTGMLAALLGQMPFLPAEPITALLGPMLGFVAWVAATFGRPGWASLTLPEPGLGVVTATYAALLALVPAALAALERRRESVPARPLRVALAALALLAAVAIELGVGDGAPAGAPARGALRITQLDVGQGDAVLLEQAGRPAALVDAGPPGGGIGRSLRELAVDRISALFVTHDDLDHSGGVGEVLEAVRVDRLVIADPVPDAAARARLAGVPVSRIAEGSEVRIGRLRLLALSPPAVSGTDVAADEDNARSLVLMARWHGWGTLLTGDAEAEATALAPGPFDVLKLAHHGSADAGLERLLETSAPRVALIGVGEGNSYGHPDEAVLATLAEHGVCVLRTDIDGDAGVEIGPGGLVVLAGSSAAARPGCSRGG